MQVSVYSSTTGEIVDSIELDEHVFAAGINVPLIHQAVVRQQANARQGTSSAKTRAEVSRTTAKLFRQKGTGRARQGSKGAPHWKGGGVAFGPKPRDYSKSMPKKMLRQAMRCALSSKVLEERLRVVDALVLEAPRTKDMVAILSRIGVANGSALIALAQADSTLVMSARNIPGVATRVAVEMSIVDVVGHDWLVMPVGAIEKATARLSNAVVAS